MRFEEQYPKVDEQTVERLRTCCRNPLATPAFEKYTGSCHAKDVAAVSCLPSLPCGQNVFVRCHINFRLDADKLGPRPSGSLTYEVCHFTKFVRPATPQYRSATRRPTANRQVSLVALVLLTKLAKDCGSGMYGTIESLMHNKRATVVLRPSQPLQAGAYPISILPLTLSRVPALGFRHGVSYIYE